MAGFSNEIVVDGVMMQSIADKAAHAAETLNTASKRMARANRHEGWRCNQKYNVSNEVNKLVVASERIARYLDQLSTVLRQGVNEIDATEKNIRSQLSSTQQQLTF